MWPKLVTPLALVEEGNQFSSLLCYSIFYPIIIFKQAHIEMCEVICPSSCLACDLNHVLCKRIFLGSSKDVLFVCIWFFFTT